jgi:PAS domain S-box-containing protein
MAIFSHGRNAMSLFDPADGRILEVNDAWLEVYGYTREEAHALRVQDVSAEPDATSRAVLEAAVTGGARIDVRWHKKKDGTIFPVELTSGTLCFGARLLMYAVMADIAPRLRAEARLLRSEARFRALFECIPVGVLVHARGAVRYMNQHLRAALGIEPDRDVELRLLELVHPDDHAAVRVRMDELLRDGVPTPPLEGRMVRRDGSHLWVEVTALPLELDGEAAMLAMVRDVGERKAMQAQLVLADRLASLGRLAASVGHEINNPLTYILGNIQLLERELLRLTDIDEQTRARLLDRLAILEDGSKRVRDIVRDLKSLSGGGETADRLVELATVLDVCANMAEHETRHRARLVRDYDEVVHVRANEGRLGQVFLNLLVNAAQAIPEGRAADNEVRVTMRRQGEDRVIVEVSDTGMGIAPEHRERIFEPFFTTKDTSGTGLGLSISHAIVASLGGSIAVEPNSPHGTCFRVTLPREPDTTRDGGPGPRSGRGPSPSRRRRPRVLVADDERMVAQMIRSMLDDCEVSIVSSGNAAIALLAAERFDAILLDLRMNDGTGADVVRWLREQQPAAESRVILMTGGSAEEILGSELPLIACPVLSKPFELHALREALERALRDV